MAGVVVVGAQWGDEGKGKIVDWLSARAEVVATLSEMHDASEFGYRCKHLGALVPEARPGQIEFEPPERCDADGLLEFADRVAPAQGSWQRVGRACQIGEDLLLVGSTVGLCEMR